MEREWLNEQLEAGRSYAAIGRELGKSASTVAYWARQHRLTSQAIRRIPLRSIHMDHVSARRRRMKETLVAEAGGACRICGYDRCLRAMQFHHLDPATKCFAVSQNGVTLALAAARAEASKCVLLCANCHAEVESGLVDLSSMIAASGVYPA